MLPGELRQAWECTARQPLRVIADSLARLPRTARVLSAAIGGQTLVLVTRHAPTERRDELASAGAEVLMLEEVKGQVDLNQALRLLAERGITSVLVEAGGTLVASLVEAGLVDKICAFVAPKLVGGKEALSPLEGPGRADMAQAIRLGDVAVERVGDDVLITAYTSANNGPREQSLAGMINSASAEH
jgi:diaminohydroxyphosphoribosylaminopyrimidine deaminase/5-amino-6-(5-phosphoribosylamino)uracil reductase